MPYVRLLGAQAAIGAAAIFARFALSGAGPLAVSALRLGIAALAVLALTRRLPRLGNKRELAFALAGLALAIHFASWIASLLFTSVAISTLLVTTTPLWTELYDVARERRTPERAFFASLGLAFCGVALIVAQRGTRLAPLAGREPLGDALALAGSLAIGAYFILVRDTGVRGRDALPTPQIVARTYGWAALCLFTAAVAARERPPSLVDGRAWLGIVAMALVSQLIGHTALNAALRDFSPSIVALTTLLEPVVAGALAAVIFGETLTPQAIAGAALVMIAIAVTLRRTGSECP